MSGLSMTDMTGGGKLYRQTFSSVSPLKVVKPTHKQKLFE